MTQPMEIEKKWLTIREAATYVGMSVAFFRKAVRQRSVPHARVGTKALRFDRDKLDRWIETNSCGGEVHYLKQRGR